MDLLRHRWLDVGDLSANNREIVEAGARATYNKAFTKEVLDEYGSMMKPLMQKATETLKFRDTMATLFVKSYTIDVGGVSDPLTMLRDSNMADQLALTMGGHALFDKLKDIGIACESIHRFLETLDGELFEEDDTPAELGGLLSF